jgi:hypothetical protein
MLTMKKSTSPKLENSRPDLEVPATLLSGQAATVSWVHRRSPVGRAIKDDMPPTHAESEFFTNPTNTFRFSNYISAWLTTSDGCHVSSYGFAKDSGIYRALSYFGIPSKAYTLLQTSRRIVQDGVEGVEFEQVAGAKTVSHLVMGGSMGGLVGCAVGILCGVVVANRLMNFPPIWTYLHMQLLASGQASYKLVRHSHFPCTSFYVSNAQNSCSSAARLAGVGQKAARNYSLAAQYEAKAVQQRAWASYGWGCFNPWGITRPTLGTFLKALKFITIQTLCHQGAGGDI